MDKSLGFGTGQPYCYLTLEYLRQLFFVSVFHLISVLVVVF